MTTYRQRFEFSRAAGAFSSAEWASLKHWQSLDPDSELQEPAFYVTRYGDGWGLWALDNLSGSRETIAKFARAADARHAAEILS